MTTYLGKSCSFCLPRVPFVNCRQFMYLVISLFGFEGRIWDLIVSVPDHCLSFYFNQFTTCTTAAVGTAVVENHYDTLCARFLYSSEHHHRERTGYKSRIKSEMI